MHGIASETMLTGEKDEVLFANIPPHFITGRYHSWIVSRKNFPTELAITAIDNQQNIMAIKHNFFDVHGLQFHPESYITREGLTILKNWLR